MDNTVNRDEVFNRAMKFVDNFKNVHPGVSNIYVFTSVDKDNNITDEKYGMNLVTNKGFHDSYVNAISWTPGTGTNNLKLYVGNGSSIEYSVTDTTLESILWGGLAATLDSSTKSYNYPMYYARSDTPGNGLITLIGKFGVFYYDYGITGVTEPTYISEYGMGPSSTSLWTHSHVYDTSGSRSSITKTPGERLIITVYLCLSLQEHVITDGWSASGNNGKNMIAITTPQIMFNRMFESSIKTYKRNGKVYQRQSCSPYSSQTIDAYHSMNTTVESSFINSSILSGFVLNEGYGNDSGYIDGFVYMTSGCTIISPEEIDTPEDIEITGLLSAAPYNVSGFSDKFGATSSGTYDVNQYPPITKLINPRAFSFNWKTGNWNNELSIYNSNDKDYDETSLSNGLATPIYYSNRNEIITRYLYQNLNPNDPILAITTGALEVYATNKYWTNTQTEPWIWIQDMSNIPQEARQCKYWITSSNTGSIITKRGIDPFQLLLPGGTTAADNGYETYNFSYKDGCGETCDNYDYGWYMRDNVIYYPSTQRSYIVGTNVTRYSTSRTYGQYIITCNSVNNKIYITDMAQASSNIVSPSEVTTDFTGTIDAYFQCYKSENGLGIILLQSVKSGLEECQFIDLRNGYSHHLENWKMSCCIWGTNKIAYVNAGSSDNNIYIYNLTTQARDGDPIPFPTGFGTIKYMFGHSNYIWFTDGTNAYVVDITSVTRSPQQITSSLFSSDIAYAKMTAVDDVLIIYKSNEYQLSNAYYVDLTSNSLDPVSLSNLNPSDSSTRNFSINMTLRYINKGTNKATLAFICSFGLGLYDTYCGAINFVCDFGLYLKTGTIRRYYGMAWPNACCIIPFGENIIYRMGMKSPTQNWLPIKITGKTNMITSMNGIKNISGKTWMINYTNVPSWGDSSANSSGIPPGNPIAATDGTGNIVGWS